MIAKTTSKQTPFKNVVLIGFTVLLFFGMSLLLIGCGNNSEEQRIAELEAEVERLQNEQNSDDASATGDATDVPLQRLRRVRTRMQIRRLGTYSRN